MSGDWPYPTSYDIVLSAEAFDAFLAELDKPAEVIPQLAALFSRPTIFDIEETP